jgi:Flp pilus assembly protein TadD
MIVKNEEAMLGRCLDSIAGLADEIIVVDTGSTDATVAIAEQRGAQVVRSDWRNDFSYSRNISIEHATCEWILWLDADDVVPPHSVAPLRALASEKPDKVFGFWIRNEKPGGTGSDFVQARMFPNRPDLRFERRIHEQIMLSALRVGMPLVNKEIVIEHHGYADPATVRVKSQRNIDLLLKEYDSASPDAVMAVELADSYLMLGDLDGAAQWFRATVEVPGAERAMPEIVSHGHLGLGKVLNEQARFADALPHFEKALRLCPDRPDVLYSMAVSLERVERIEDALAALKAIAALKPRPLSVSVDFREASIKAYLRMERLLCRTGRLSEAEAVAREALERHGNRPEMHSMLGRALFRGGKYMDALHAFEASLGIAQQGNLDAYAGLCCIYVRADRIETADKTLESVRPGFAPAPRYLALETMIRSEMAPLPAVADPAKVAEELAYLKTVFAWDTFSTGKAPA